MAQMDGAVSYCFWEICSKNTGLQGSTLSGPRMTTGFGPFELPTRGLLLTLTLVDILGRTLFFHLELGGHLLYLLE